MELHAPLGVWQICGQGCDSPLIVVTHPRAHAAMCVSSPNRNSAGGQGHNVLSASLSLCFTMHGGFSRIDRKQRGSKLIIQCAGNVSEASAGRLETTKGLL